jgi:DNA-binding CsgD family transcriptional regulator
MALGEETGCAEAVFNGLNNVGSVKILKGDLTGVADLERIRELTARAGSEFGVGRAFLHLCWMPSMRREWGVVASHLEPATAYCSEHGPDLWLDRLTSLRAELALAHGRWDEAAAGAAAILDRDPAFGPMSRFSAMVVLAKVRARRGEAGPAALLDDALELARLSGLAPVALLAISARAEIAWLEGRPAAVIDGTAIPLEAALRLQPMAACELLDWRRRAGAERVDLDGLPDPYRMQFGGDSAGAAQWWRDRGCAYEAALALAGFGDITALQRALDELRGLGARPAMAIIGWELRTLGGRVPRTPRPATQAHPAGLTQREADVLALLAVGMRNAEIATRLSVSPRTVDHHVSSIMRKLNVRTRGQASAVAVRLGLTQS